MPRDGDMKQAGGINWEWQDPNPIFGGHWKSPGWPPVRVFPQDDNEFLVTVFDDQKYSFSGPNAEKEAWVFAIRSLGGRLP